MSRAVRVLAFIIGSGWFVPVSCTTGLFVAIPVWSKFDERDIEKGEQPHPLFFVVWQPGEAGELFGYTRLKDLSRIETSEPTRSFIMEKASGRIEGGKNTIIAYKVLSSGTSEQLIEVAYSDDTYDSVSRYRATRAEITPTFSKLMQPGYMFMAFPIALGLAGAIYVIGRRLRKRVARANAKEDVSSRVDPLLLEDSMSKPPLPCCPLAVPLHLTELAHVYQFDFDLFRCKQCSRYWVYAWRMGVGDWEAVTTDDAEKMQSLDSTELRAFMKVWAQAFN